MGSFKSTFDVNLHSFNATVANCLQANDSYIIRYIYIITSIYVTGFWKTVPHHLVIFITATQTILHI